jgi:hypothetical protein
MRTEEQALFTIYLYVNMGLVPETRVGAKECIVPMICSGTVNNMYVWCATLIVHVSSLLVPSSHRVCSIPTDGTPSNEEN